MYVAFTTTQTAFRLLAFLMVFSNSVLPSFRMMPTYWRPKLTTLIVGSRGFSRNDGELFSQLQEDQVWDGVREQWARVEQKRKSDNGQAIHQYTLGDCSCCKLWNQDEMVFSSMAKKWWRLHNSILMPYMGLSFISQAFKCFRNIDYEGDTRNQWKFGNFVVTYFKCIILGHQHTSATFSSCHKVVGFTNFDPLLVIQWNKSGQVLKMKANSLMYWNSAVQ